MWGTLASRVKQVIKVMSAYKPSRNEAYVYL